MFASLGYVRDSIDAGHTFMRAFASPALFRSPHSHKQKAVRVLCTALQSLFLRVKMSAREDHQ